MRTAAKCPGNEIKALIKMRFHARARAPIYPGECEIIKTATAPSLLPSPPPLIWFLTGEQHHSSLRARQVAGAAFSEYLAILQRWTTTGPYCCCRSACQYMASTLQTTVIALYRRAWEIMSRLVVLKVQRQNFHYIFSYQNNYNKIHSFEVFS